MQAENELIIAQKVKDLEKFKQIKEIEMEKQVIVIAKIYSMVGSYCE
jgi:hypothetical protein